MALPSINHPRYKTSLIICTPLIHPISWLNLSTLLLPHYHYFFSRPPCHSLYTIMTVCKLVSLLLSPLPRWFSTLWLVLHNSSHLMLTPSSQFPKCLHLALLWYIYPDGEITWKRQDEWSMLPLYFPAAKIIRWFFTTFQKCSVIIFSMIMNSCLWTYMMCFSPHSCYPYWSSNDPIFEQWKLIYIGFGVLLTWP